MNNRCGAVVKSIALLVKFPTIFSIVVKGWSEYTRRIRGKLPFQQQFSAKRMLGFDCFAGAVVCGTGYFAWQKY